MDLTKDLANELMQLILNRCSVRDIMSCAQVSRRWNEQAKAAWNFWRIVDLTSTAPHALELFARRIVRPGNFSVSVKIVLQAEEDVLPFRDVVLPILVSVMDRIDHFTLQLPVNCDRDLQQAFCSVPAPRMWAFFLQFIPNTERSKANIFHPDLFAGQCPKLTDLVLRNVALSREVPPAFNNVIWVSYHYDDGDCAPLPLPEAAAMPKIRGVAIAGAFNPPEEGLYDPAFDEDVKLLTARLLEIHFCRQYEIPVQFFRWKPLRGLQHLCTGDRKPEVVRALIKQVPGDRILLWLLQDEPKANSLPILRSPLRGQFKISYMTIEHWLDDASGLFRERDFVDYRQIYDELDGSPHPALADKTYHARVGRMNILASLWILCARYLDPLPNVESICLTIEKASEIPLMALHRISMPKLRHVKFITVGEKIVEVEAAHYNRFFSILQESAEKPDLNVEMFQLRVVDGDSACVRDPEPA
ncbi:hypothetical protein BKA62DRAFT_712996 [Auriculariales sp. MPI-PUGE-AT-0066]|nr:hypothetical protein BKA62DRAFT_712996 [Auriculariales sp. MPI-PUGE-AT-0066]